MQGKDMFELIDTLPYFYDEPFGDSSALPTMVVSKLAKKDVTVALSADGGDEAFCGYSKYFFLNKFSNIFAQPFKKKILELSLNSMSVKSVETLNNLLPKKLKQSNIQDKYIKFKRAINSKTKQEMFINASSFVDSRDVFQTLSAFDRKTDFSKFDLSINNQSYLDYMMAVDYKTFMNDMVLTKVDRATMSVSLEGREPLLDHRIVEYMARIPQQIKYKNGQGKYLLRQILYKYIPQEMVDKPKSGFAMPLNEWLRGDLRFLVKKYLDVKVLDDEIFDVDYVLTLKQDLLLGKYVNINQIWYIIMFQMWRERWFN